MFAFWDTVQWKRTKLTTTWPRKLSTALGCVKHEEKFLWLTMKLTHFEISQASKGRENDSFKQGDNSVDKNN